jgi:hypothetical protein
VENVSLARFYAVSLSLISLITLTGSEELCPRVSLLAWMLDRGLHLATVPARFNPNLHAPDGCSLLVKYMPRGRVFMAGQ